MNSLVDVLRTHADARPDAFAFGFLSDGQAVSAQLTYAQLDEQARVIGATLQQLTKPGDRAILLYQPGLEFVVAFLGCQYAGVVAVPALPPNMSRVQASVERLALIVDNAKPSVILTTAELLPTLRGATRGHGEYSGILWQATNRLNAARASAWRRPALGPDDLSFLQFTSGSTSAPKGVMVSQSNILANLEMLWASARADHERPNCVGWLPQYHDMGLIGVTLFGLYLGTETRLMSPLSFLKRPMRWLQAIAAHGDVFSGGPNFAYEAVLRRVTEADKQDLDLSRWRTAFCGAETVRARTLDRFFAEFADCGLDRRAQLPCYGLAEATLVVSCRTPGRNYQAIELDQAQFEQGVAVAAEADGLSVVSCGVAQCGQEIAIVDPSSMKRCADGAVGEIWIRGANVARGYWDKPERCAETFAATTSEGEGPFLRTGDLGFVHDGELYVTGRLKELIIIRGRCLYPQDLELMVESMADEFPEIVANESVAFALTGDDQERIGLLVKIARRRNPTHDADALNEAIQARALEQFEVGFAEIVQVKSSVPKTSSGKKMRRACAQLMLEGRIADEFRIEHHWRQVGVVREPEPEQSLAAANEAPIGHAELASSVVEWLAREQQIDPASISITQPFTDFGLDSFVAVSLIDFLERQLGTALSSSLLTDHRNIDELCRHLVKRHARPAGKPARAPKQAAVKQRGIG